MSSFKDKSSEIDEIRKNAGVVLHGAARFSIERELGDTLQGRMYAGTDRVTQKQVVIKEAWRNLVDSGVCRDGHRVGTDFIKERRLVMTLTNLPNCTEGTVLNNYPCPFTLI